MRTSVMTVKGPFGAAIHRGNPDSCNGETEWIWIVVEGAVQLGRDVCSNSG